MKYKAVLFDLDGTLLDTTDGVIDAVKRTITANGFEMPPDSVLKEFVGPPMQQSMKEKFLLDPDSALRVANEFRANYNRYSLYKAHLYKGVMELLNKLKEMNYLLAVATNKSHENAISILKHFGILDLCDYALGSDLEGKLSKSDIIEMCISNLKVKKTEAVLIGDSIYDLNGAEKAGIDFVAVTYGFGFAKGERISSGNCVRQIDTVEAVISYFENQKRRTFSGLKNGL